jgi:hypothetical protein
VSPPDGLNSPLDLLRFQSGGLMTGLRLLEHVLRRDRLIVGVGLVVVVTLDIPTLLNDLIDDGCT